MFSGAERWWQYEDVYDGGSAAVVMMMMMMMMIMMMMQPMLIMLAGSDGRAGGVASQPASVCMCV